MHQNFQNIDQVHFDPSAFAGRNAQATMRKLDFWLSPDRIYYGLQLIHISSAELISLEGAISQKN